MTSALAMHDHLLRLLLHQHCGYEVSMPFLWSADVFWDITGAQLVTMHADSVHGLPTLLPCPNTLTCWVVSTCSIETIHVHFDRE